MGVTSGDAAVRLHGLGVRGRWVYEGRLTGVGEAAHRATGAPRKRSSSTRLGSGQDSMKRH